MAVSMFRLWRAGLETVLPDEAYLARQPLARLRHRHSQLLWVRLGPQIHRDLVLPRRRRSHISRYFRFVAAAAQSRAFGYATPQKSSPGADVRFTERYVGASPDREPRSVRLGTSGRGRTGRVWAGAGQEWNRLPGSSMSGPRLAERASRAR